MLCCTTNAAPVALKAEPFSLSDVRLLDGPFKDNMERDRTYMLSLDAGRLLHNFRVAAGLASSAKPYGGWEKPDCELRGHSVGHYLSACASMFASTGDVEFKKRADYIVAEFAKCQDAMPSQGYNSGFLSAYPESIFDRALGLKHVWAPFYTLHKIMAGLLDVNLLCGNRQALDVLEKLANWVKFRVDQLPPDQIQKMMDQSDVAAKEIGGMSEVLANLSAVTDKREYLELARKFDHTSLFDSLAQGKDVLNGIHANTQIPKMIGAAREYELTGDKRDHDIASFFWQRVAQNRSYAPGGHSDNEHFFPPEEFSKHLSPVTMETCNTYNMLKLTRHLFAWEPSAVTMDFYERALYNHILGSQDPENGMMTYYVSLKPGHFKVYSSPEDSFWCCVGTGIENHANYGDTIYFHDAGSLYVNLFIASELTWKEKDLVVRQETKFPETDKTTLTMKCANPVKLALKIRRPAWADTAATVWVNGEKQTIESTPGSYMTIDRTWHDGDKIEVQLPMRLHVEQLPNTPNVIAVLYGPIVLAADLGAEDLPADGQQSTSPGKFHKWNDPDAPVFVCKADEVLSHIKPVAGESLSFRTEGLVKPGDVTLVPFHRLHHKRYSVYWTLCSEEDWKQMQAKGSESAAK